MIATQEGSGVEVVTDGEMRRFLFMEPVTDTVAGIELVEHGTPMPWASPEGETEWSSPAAVTSKLEKKRSMVCEEYSNLRARPGSAAVEGDRPSPLVLYGFWSTEYSTAAYKDPFAMFADAAEVGRSEIQELVSLGCSYIQVDAPELATLVDPRVRDWAQAQGMPAERMLTEGIDLINETVAGVSGARNADRRTRAGTHLAQAPDDKQVVLGLVSTKSAREETVAEITARIDEGARSFPREQLGISTQCGFASIADGNPITEQTEGRKLQLVAEGASAAWG